MDENFYKKMFAKLKKLEPREGLRARILAKMEEVEGRQKAKKKAWLFGGISGVSLVFSVWTVFELVKNFRTSGFWQYISLAFSDAAMLNYSREILLSLTESLPMMGLATSLICIGFFIWSIGKISPPAPSYNKRGFASISPLL